MLVSHDPRKNVSRKLPNAHGSTIPHLAVEDADTCTTSLLCIWNVFAIIFIARLRGLHFDVANNFILKKVLTIFKMFRECIDNFMTCQLCDIKYPL